MEDHCAEYHSQVVRRTSEWMGTVLPVLPEGGSLDHTQSCTVGGL